MFPAIIQARSGSSRLPRKVLEKVLGKPLFVYLIERIRAVSAIGRIVLATTVSPEDDDLSALAASAGIEVFRGSIDDVLGRMVKCTEGWPDGFVVRFWGDSPLIDPQIVSNILERTERDFQTFDYVSNCHPSTYPEGMQVEVVKVGALRQADGASDVTPFDREHVTPYLWQRPGVFALGNVEHSSDIHDAYRICLDYPEDLAQIRAIVEQLYPANPTFALADIVALLDSRPDIKERNLNRYEDCATYFKRIGCPDTA